MVLVLSLRIDAQTITGVLPDIILIPVSGQFLPGTSNIGIRLDLGSRCVLAAVPYYL